MSTRSSLASGGASSSQSSREGSGICEQIGNIRFNQLAAILGQVREEEGLPLPPQVGGTCSLPRVEVIYRACSMPGTSVNTFLP